MILITVTWPLNSTTSCRWRFGFAKLSKTGHFAWCTLERIHVSKVWERVWVKLQTSNQPSLYPFERSKSFTCSLYGPVVSIHQKSTTLGILKTLLHRKILRQNVLIVTCETTVIIQVTVNMVRLHEFQHLFRKMITFFFFFFFF